MKTLAIALIFSLIAGCSFADTEATRNINGINISVLEAGDARQ